MDHAVVYQFLMGAKVENMGLKTTEELLDEYHKKRAESPGHSSNENNSIIRNGSAGRISPFAITCPKINPKLAS